MCAGPSRICPGKTCSISESRDRSGSWRSCTHRSTELTSLGSLRWRSRAPARWLTQTQSLAVELRKQIPATLTLNNTTTSNVAFKARVMRRKPLRPGCSPSPFHAFLVQVKTTSPKKYCVRPNTGVIPPGGTVEVTLGTSHASTQERS